ncbi:DeoR/GlpR family DNA-binding transcription regulator [Maribellus sp. YY47]|uniref:DeoR/GlpR family DNA-binding transcription regulator n=1 Tax=Maribellus sp. YY47 TaxID=2929486 RepID=UPI0020013DC3|nr:DeoR/GlpR family DNA-binding transcription regulator [Maribellus sp. YY47]MCK3684724.1 DeoR/GlpR family DNA-binding transcription regulator [Maribellus sp. YY47]
MLSIAERHKYILDKLHKNGFIKVSDIAHELDVTPVTVRKDLKSLEEKKLLYRTHGSASPVNPHTADIDLQEKEKMSISEKKLIAKAACSLIEPNDSIIIASGSTAHTFAQELNPQDSLTVVSASLKTSMLLNNNPNIELIQLGGIVRKNSFSVVGDFASRLFEDLTCSKLFLGVDGIDIENGITNSNIEESVLNKRMMKAALRTIILSDSSKFGRRGFGKICNLDQIDMIITDSGIPKHMADTIEEMGIELIIVGENGSR